LVSRFLQKIGSKDLISLTVCGVDFYDSKDQDPLIQSVLEICGQKWLTLRTSFFDVTDVNLTGAGCAPLANLTSLEHLRFGSYRRVPITDALLLAAVKPLQNLVSLCALSWRGLIIEALHHVSLHLPRLKSLKLTFEPPFRPPPIGS
jgi:hypothetical protein